MIRNKTILTLVGFILAGIGFMALVLSLVGVKLSFLAWLDDIGALFGFVSKIVLILVGMIMIYMGKTNLQEEEV